MSRATPTTLSTLAYALLALLADRPMTGYELTHEFDRSLTNVWSARHSQIYPELAKLHEVELIRLAGSGARGSKQYRTTPKGVEALRTWLRSTEPIQGPRNEAMLRLFFLWLLEPEEAETYLQAEETRHGAQLTRYRELLPKFPAHPDRATKWSRIMLEYGIRYETMILEWTRWARSQIRGKRPAKRT